MPDTEMRCEVFCPLSFASIGHYTHSRMISFRTYTRNKVDGRHLATNLVYILNQSSLPTSTTHQAPFTDLLVSATVVEDSASSGHS